MENKRDSLRYSADGSQEGESDKSSEDKRSDEDDASTFTEESSDHHFDFAFEFPDEKGSKADTKRASEQLRTEIKMASLPVRNEVFRLRNENKDLRCQICDARTELNKVGKFSRFQGSLITRFEDELQDLRESRVKTVISIRICSYWCYRSQEEPCYDQIPDPGTSSHRG